VIAVDTNVLVYAHVESSAKHELARATLVGLAEGAQPWGLPAPCLVEFMRVVTHPRVLAQPYTVGEAAAALSAVLASPSCAVLCPGDEHWELLSSSAERADARGNLMFDAAIAAICQEVGVTRLITEDRDFARFGGRPLIVRLEDVR
jgi:uncharacterized protein